MPFGCVSASHDFWSWRTPLKGSACRQTTMTDAFCHTPRSLFRTQILISSLASLSCKTASRLFLPYFLRHAIVKKQTHHTNTHSGPCVSPFLSKLSCSNVRAKAHAATHKNSDYTYTYITIFSALSKKNNNLKYNKKMCRFKAQSYSQTRN